MQCPKCGVDVAVSEIMKNRAGDFTCLECAKTSLVDPPQSPTPASAKPKASIAVKTKPKAAPQSKPMPARSTVYRSSLDEPFFDLIGPTLFWVGIVTGAAFSGALIFIFKQNPGELWSPEQRVGVAMLAIGILQSLLLIAVGAAIGDLIEKRGGDNE